MSSVFEGKHKQLSLVSKHDHCQNLFTMIFQLQVKFTQSVLLSKNMPLKWPWQLSIVSDSNCIIHEAQYAWKAWCWWGGGGLLQGGLLFCIYLTSIYWGWWMQAMFSTWNDSGQGERGRGGGGITMYHYMTYSDDWQILMSEVFPQILEWWGMGGGQGYNYTWLTQGRFQRH